MELENIFKAVPKLSIAERQMIEKAYKFACQAHEGQTRKSGEPYMIHPVAVAQILAELRKDAKVISAALLHDSVEDTPVTLDDIEEKFDIEVARLVAGVTKMHRLPTTVEPIPGVQAE